MNLRHVFCILVFLSAPVPIFVTISGTYALQQLAGPITVNVKPGETKYFTWGLLTDQNSSNTVNLTADGTGSEFLSFPKSVVLTPGNLSLIQGNVTVPSAVPGGIELKPTIHALEVGKNGQLGGAQVNIQMSKVLTLIIGKNATLTDKVE